MVDDAKQLRQALLALALNKKCERIEQKLEIKVNKVTAEFETSLLDYMNAVNKLKLVIELAERHKKKLDFLTVLKDCSALTRNFSARFALMYELFESILPVSTINPDWLNNITKQEKRLVKIKEMLEKINMLSCNQSVTETVQRMVMQITDIQEKVKVSNVKIRDAMLETTKYCSNVLHNLQANHLDNSNVDTTFEDEDNSFFE